MIKSVHDFQLLDPAGVGAIISVTAKTVRDKYSKLDGFPDPVFLPAGEKGCSRKRWKKTDIIDWLDRINHAE